MANGNGKVDWKWVVTLVLVALGWAYTLGVSRYQLEVTTKMLDQHIHEPYHPGVRILTDVNAADITTLKERLARIEAKLDEALKDRNRR